MHELDLIQRGSNVYALLATPGSERFDPVNPNDGFWIADLERHEVPHDRAVMKGHRRQPVAAGLVKLGAA